MCAFLFHQLLQVAVGLLDALAEHLGIELGTEERGVCVVALVVLGGLLLAACLAVEVVGSEVMHIHEGYAKFVSNLLSP